MMSSLTDRLRKTRLVGPLINLFLPNKAITQTPTLTQTVYKTPVEKWKVTLPPYVYTPRPPTTYELKITAQNKRKTINYREAERLLKRCELKRLSYNTLTDEAVDINEALIKRCKKVLKPLYEARLRQKVSCFSKFVPMSERTRNEEYPELFY